MVSRAPNEQDIKRLSGSYDLEIIKRLNYSQQRIANLGMIAACKNVEELDLSGNFLENLDGIENLTSLRILNLSDNKLKNLKGIDRLKNLQVLHLEKNSLFEWEVGVKPFLLGLDKLRAIYFRGRADTGSNTLCRHPSYPLYVLQTLRTLQVIDGERVSLRETARTDALDKLCKELPPVIVPESEPWTRDFDWGSPFQVPEQLDLEINFRTAISDCKKLAKGVL
mmetsp:Transcript_27002/g.43489  ORF Transcript_27002/g.43489 Transcript_27002/m.43489 type:complete len:224 (-) Transcript_27002:98-769(-)|eukprot:CAMPEP_0203747166 /NCGR_PEP_ID=MMETSP0098-20131031/2400_1 /ASSEMBLY_ACC=CAM_ASM_000208 /TAXON_ID=96639 /ORGANISM=" , Strain NY0313808BC1" /LENGTH=223 /DNA_ID=CAMNT_0050635517 /DNA_START=1321 /DNA_END=1992 /DNA_ORIENTATION=+